MRPGPILRLTATEGRLVTPLGGVGWAVGNRRHVCGEARIWEGPWRGEGWNRRRPAGAPLRGEEDSPLDLFVQPCNRAAR